MTSFPVILSAPSGAGKTTIAERIVSSRSDVGYSISATTRARRDYETDGKEYFFLTQDEFERRRVAGDFAEYAEVHGRWYGTLKSEIERMSAAGKHTLLDIDVQGARRIRLAFPRAVLIFVLPPGYGTMITRLRRRMEPEESIKVRIQTAVLELSAVEEFDYVVVNDDLDRAVAQVAGIIDSEALRTSRGILEAGPVSSLVRRLRVELLHPPGTAPQ